jgi:hypothetical protein
LQHPLWFAANVGEGDQRFPGGSDADYRAMRPTLLAELSTEAAQADEAARETMRRRLRSAF